MVIHQEKLKITSKTKIIDYTEFFRKSFFFFCSNTGNQLVSSENNLGAIPKKRTKIKSQSSNQTSTPLTPSQILMQSRANMESTPTKRIRQNTHSRNRSKFDEIDLENEMSPNTRHLLEIRRELNYQGDVLSNIVREANTYHEVKTFWNFFQFYSDPNVTSPILE